MIITFPVPLHLLVAPKGEMREGPRKEGRKEGRKGGREAPEGRRKGGTERGRERPHTSSEEKGERRRALHQGREGENHTPGGKE